ncbi:MAG: DUF3772 domain-containing protein [Pseudomonadota bacterium]
MLRRFLFALPLLLLACLAAAQTEPDYAEWEQVASRAENAVEAAAASSAAFATLREEIDGFRSVFSEAQGINSARLETLRGQIGALGAPPEEGATEEEGIAQRRAELEAQLAELAAPALRAEEAFRRADGIIGEIDAIIRERRAEALLSRRPSPLDPGGWIAVPDALQAAWRILADGAARNVANGSAREAINQNLPLIITLLVVALVAVLRSRRWLEILGERLEGRGEGAGIRVSSFLVSLGQIAVPMVGMFALTRALILTDLFDVLGERLVALIPFIGFAIFMARWLAGRLFPSSEAAVTPLRLDAGPRRKGRFTVFYIGIAVAVFGVFRAVAELGSFSLSTRGVLEFPVLLVLGLLLYRLSIILLSHARSVNSEGLVQPSVFDRLVTTLARFARIVAIVGPALSALGYVNAAEALMLPAVATLTLFAVLALLTGLIRDVYILLGRGKGPDESLVPVLASTALFIASAPILALIWGASVTDLREVWVRIQEGVTVGETTISPGAFFVLILVFAGGYALTRFVQSALRTSVLPKTRLDVGGQTAVVSGLGYVGVFLAGLLAISAAGIDLSSLAFIAGALGVGIGFGLQNIVSNFISGIILLVERPISEGDWIEVGGNMGYVRDISVRSTRIETFDRTDVIVPNADLISGTVTNYTRGNTVGRVIVPVGVAYGTDTKRVEAILQEIAEAHPMVNLKPPPFVYFKGFGADSLDFEIRAILRDIAWVLVVQTEMNHSIAQRFAAEGIEIPFAQRDIWLRNPEALTPASRPLSPEGKAEEGQPRSDEAPETAHPDFRATDADDGDASQS